MWSHDGYRELVERLAESHSVVCFDAPGTGLSERSVTTVSIDEELAVLESVLGAAGVSSSRKASLFSSSIAASTAIRFGALRPELVERLVLFGSCLRGEDLGSGDARDALLQLIRKHWGLGSRSLSDIFLPGVPSADREWFHAFQLRSAVGAMAARRLQMYYESDVSDDAKHVRAPTLVVHRTDDRAVRLGHGVAVAAAIDGAILEPVDGAEHLCFLGDWGQVTDLVVRFLEPTVVAMLPKGPYGSFTSREMDVAEMTTLGLTNAAIGERLGISPRTVESHLERIRHKLGVRSRTEVAAWMARRSDIR